MHGLKSTSHPGLYKLGKTYWCKIKVKGIYRERSLRISSETEALKTLGRWRNEMELVAVRTQHKSGAGCSLKCCTWAAAYYAAKRKEGKSHACALRCLAQRWLKILWKMRQTHTPYDPEYHARNQQRHGSWVLQLNPKTT